GASMLNDQDIHLRTGLLELHPGFSKYSMKEPEEEICLRRVIDCQLPTVAFDWLVGFNF
ncbi:unnamed protein product, partial [Allacma fusca]